MGYRLGVKTKSDFINKNFDREKYWEGGKLYGYSYADEEENLESFKYLKNLGKFKDCDVIIWDYSFSYDIELTKKQFEKFAKLYIEDCAKAYGDKWTLEDTEEMNKQTKDFLKNVNENVILSWG